MANLGMQNIVHTNFRSFTESLEAIGLEDVNRVPTVVQKRPHASVSELDGDPFFSSFLTDKMKRGANDIILSR